MRDDPDFTLMVARGDVGLPLEAGCDEHETRSGPSDLEEANMNASVGDRIVVNGHRVGEATRDCEVLEVRGPDGGAPYMVRWRHDGHEGLFFPGPDASVQHSEHGTN
jgi:hypothetical protein